MLESLISSQVVGRIKIDVCSLGRSSRHLCGLGPVGGDESVLGGHTLCPQVSILGDQEGRQEGHVGDGEGHLTDWMTELVSVGEEASFACLSPKLQVSGHLAQDPGSASGSQGPKQARGHRGTGRLCWVEAIWVKSLCSRLNDEATSYGSRTCLEPGSPKPSAGLLSDNPRNG